MSRGSFEIGRDGPGVLVVGLDDSVASIHALAYAVGMARREGSEIVIVQVVALVSSAAAVAGAAGVALPAEEVTEPLPASAMASLDELLPGRWRRVARRGDPAGEVERVAHETRADAIVVGRSRSPSRHLLGSVAARLVRHADTPVIVVP